MNDISLICNSFAAYLDGHLLVFSETHIDVFNAASSLWVQTINVKKARPLNTTGSASICNINDMTHIIHIANLHHSEYEIAFFCMLGGYVCCLCAILFRYRMTKTGFRQFRKFNALKKYIFKTFETSRDIGFSH